jgi:hypothetical protein
LTHAGVTQVIEKAKELAGHQSPHSANLVSLLANQIEGIHLLTSAMSELPQDNSEGEAKLFADCVRKVRLNFLEKNIKQLAIEIKANPSSVNMEKLRDLQRERLIFVKESSSN